MLAIYGNFFRDVKGDCNSDTGELLFQKLYIYHFNKANYNFSKEVYTIIRVLS